MIDLLGDLKIESISTFLLIISVFSPGFIINHFRNAFVTGRKSKLSEELLKFIIVSSVYYSVAIPLVWHFENFSLLAGFVTLFFAPVIIGIVLGVLHQRGLNSWIFGFLKLNPVHPAPTAWDYVFGTMKGNHWVVITLSDGIKIYGYFGQKSMASSDIENKDIYVEMLTDCNFEIFGDDGRSRGIWIEGKNISSIEAISEEIEGENHDREENSGKSTV